MCLYLYAEKQKINPGFIMMLMDQGTYAFKGHFIPKILKIAYFWRHYYKDKYITLTF